MTDFQWPSTSCSVFVDDKIVPVLISLMYKVFATHHDLVLLSADILMHGLVRHWEVGSVHMHGTMTLDIAYKDSFLHCNSHSYGVRLCTADFLYLDMVAILSASQEQRLTYFSWLMSA